MRSGWTLARPRPIHVQTPEDVRRLKEKISHTDLVAIDTETTGLDISRCVVVYWSLSTGDDRYFLERPMLEEFDQVFQDKRISWLGSQIKYDAHMLANSGHHLAGDLFCTLSADRLLDPGRPHGLKDAYEREFNERMMTFGETFYPRNKSGRPQKPRARKGQPPIELYHILTKMFQQNPDRVIDYASLDAWGVFRLFDRQRSQLKAIQTWRGYSLYDLFLFLEVPFTRVLYDMEQIGIRVNVEYLTEAEETISQRQADIEKKLNHKIGDFFNPASPPQVGAYLFEKLGLKPLKKTAGGAPSVDESVLTHYAAQGVEVAELVLEHRKLGKLLGTYVRGLLTRMDADGRVHTTLNQHIADTGRLSSSDPNLQNVPVTSSFGFEIRNAFIASPGHKLIVNDYDQVEMFLLAHFSNDEGMLRNIWMGRDIHTSNVELVWNEPYDDVAAAKKNKHDTSSRAEYLRKLRRRIKTIGFGLNYGKAARKLSIELEFPEKLRDEHPDWSDKQIDFAAKVEAQELINLYFARVPGAAQFIKGTIRRAADTKYVETYLGRRRLLPDIMDWSEQESHRHMELMRGRDLCWCNACRLSRDAERKTVNSIIQGSAADIIQTAMILCHTDPYMRQLQYRMLLQIHDELVGEAPYEYVEEAAKRKQFIMEHPGLDLRVPLRADPGIGNTWLEAK